jgi:Protein of unknown function (DUF2934)
LARPNRILGPTREPIEQDIDESTLGVVANNTSYKIEMQSVWADISTMEGAVLKEQRMPKARTTTSETPKKTRKATGPSHDDIAARAYQIYQARGYTPGDPMQDWLQAERELAAKPKKTGRKTKVVSIAA